ncbi:hypothetical protein BLS_007040 [Venturia inaequalis]|uniref:Uncharacterized protein n=1 Tax=Venturia inaequalis TaxID=5025 RepID=A0A8H3U9K6_VENIN|nr:hypothetical protein BLS_007040 [Venturia inaequalis]RDI88373.1 hypothetical protein Vi05172_g1144 [Venturia inaequalis]
MRATSITLVAFGAIAVAQLQVRGVIPSSSEAIPLTFTTSVTRTNTLTATRTLTCSHGATNCQTEASPVVVPSTTITTSSTTTQSVDVLPATTESSSCSTVITLTVGNPSQSTVTVRSTTTATTSIVTSTFTPVAPTSSNVTTEPAAPSSSTPVSPELTSQPASSSSSTPVYTELTSQPVSPSSSTEVSPEFTTKPSLSFVYPPYGSGNSTTYYGTGTGSITSLVSQTLTATPKPSSTEVSPVLSNKSSKMTAPVNGLALMVTALMMVFMSLGDNLSLVSFAFLLLDCAYTRSMGCSVFVIAYFAVGGSAFLLGETTLKQFLDMSV